MASLRNMTEQFANGTDISASRIEANLDQLFAALNEVQPKHKIRRFVETHQVFGYSPPYMPAPIQLPWLPALIDAGEASTLQPPTTFLNQYRHKASWLATAGQIIWEIAFTTANPCILKNATVVLQTNTEYPNPFVWGAAPPVGKVVGEPVDDFSFQVLIDSAMQTEDRAQTSVEALTTGIKIDRFKISSLGINPIWDTMNPTHPEAPMNGVFVELPVLAFIPARARVRLQIILPKYPNPWTQSGWDRYSWMQQVWSGQITLLEPEE